MSDQLPLEEEALAHLSAMISDVKSTTAMPGGLPWLQAARMVALHNGIETEALVAVDANLVQMAEAWDCRIRRVSLTGKWWLSDNGPLLVYDRESKPYAMLPGDAGYYTAYAGENASAIPVTETFIQTLAPQAFMFYACFPESGLRLRDLLKRASGLIKHQGFALIRLQAMMGLLSLLMPIAMGRLFNEVIPSAAYFLLGQWSFILISAVVLIGLLAYQQVLLMIRMRFKFSLLLQAGLWDRILRLPVAFIHQFEVGDLAARSMVFNQLQQLLSGAAIQGVLGLVFAVFPLLLMFYYSWCLSLIVLVISFITLGFYLFAFQVLSHYQTLLLDQRAKASSFIVQLLQNISRIRTQGAEVRFYHVWVKKFMAGLQSFYKINLMGVYLAAWNSVMTVGLSMIVFGMAASFEPAMNFGDFIAFFSAYGLFAGVVFSLNQLLLTLAPVLPWLKRIEPLLSAPREKSISAKSVPVLKGAITLEKVSFGYENQAPILENVSLTIAPGECIGIVGPSGSGKSTLIRLLLGFLQPLEGKIFYDDEDLSQLNLSELRRQLGVVLQQDTLMTGNVLENLSDGLPLNEEKIRSVLEAVDMRQWLERLPMGLQTVLLDGGLTLSAGERQRLLMARALIQEPKILLLDEASSALDNITQTKMHDNLMNTTMTKIIIAQRTSTLHRAHRIYQMKAGTLVPAR